MDAFLHADGIICDSATMRDNLIRILGMPDAKVLDVPIGVDEGTLASRTVSPQVRAAYRPSGHQMVLNVARIAPYKDQLTLVRATALVHRALPSMRLYIAGPCSDRSYAKKLAKEVKHLGLERVVTFLGQVSRPLLLELFELCDVFILSSVSEALGLSLLEAMAKAKPVVASAIGPILEILPPRGGITVPPQDPYLMSRAVLELLHNPGQAREMGERARDHVLTEYRWSRIAQRTRHAYEMIRPGVIKT
jgi:glycosyltransferase involved in cell wall biosynthesis